MLMVVFMFLFIFIVVYVCIYADVCIYLYVDICVHVDVCVVGGHLQDGNWRHVYSPSWTERSLYVFKSIGILLIKFNNFIVFINLCF